MDDMSCDMEYVDDIGSEVADAPVLDAISCYWYQYTFHVQSQHPLPSTSRYPVMS